MIFVKIYLGVMLFFIALGLLIALDEKIDIWLDKIYDLRRS